jgi:hypothetical protein
MYECTAFLGHGEISWININSDLNGFIILRVNPLSLSTFVLWDSGGNAALLLTLGFLGIHQTKPTCKEIVTLDYVMAMKTNLLNDP